MEQFSMATRYDASQSESKWYARWEEQGLFQPDPDPAKPVYSITIPPPNITGSLHMGHALVYSLQDMLGRYHRLRGHRVLILPGQDHAGIATQSVVDKQLRKEGTSAAQIGREKFVERVWEWRKQSGDTILHQFRSLGCAFDWSRLRFTLDDAYAQAVLKVFVDWFERGLIFRGKRVVNWDPKLQTSVSDIETLREVRKGKLYHIRYPFEDGSGEIVIATTRPETMLADVAVAVHPSDTRYKGLIGKHLILPLTGRRIPLIEDIYPDPAFGTGAVKITPAHDPNDYSVGVRHNLEMPVILDPKARISLEGPYFGMDRNEARKQIVHDLETQGFLVKVEDHEIPIVISDRSGEVIEPLLSEQWFCDQAKLAGPVIQAVRSEAEIPPSGAMATSAANRESVGEVTFYPARYNRIFIEWMENIREWCLSRQLWWGHRIPVYYTEEGQTFAALTWEEAQQKAGDAKIVSQDEDVLDTWFSSGLWPFATMGWPEQTEDLKTFYPTSVLVTDRNIINLWVARMLMMGYDLTGQMPFKDVEIHATVMREDGRRMSKSLGTGVDPMEVIESIGADALRWTLLSQSGENQEIRYSERRTEDARNFANKIWNATRFVLMNVSEEHVAPLAHAPGGLGVLAPPRSKPRGALGGTPSKSPPTTDNQPPHLEPVDKWLLSRLHATEQTVRAAYDAYNLQEACQALQRFFWDSVCDWYLEICKPRLQDPARRETPQKVLLTCFDAFLKMLHPVMPHLTEELYAHLPIEGKSPMLMSSIWPDLPEDFRNPQAEADLERTFEITVALRALRASLDIPALRTVPVAYVEGDLGSGADIVRTQAWIEDLRAGPPEGEKQISQTVAGVKIHLPITGLVDTDKLLSDLERDRTKLEAERAQVDQQLSNPTFVERAKPEVVEKARARLTEIQARLETLESKRLLLTT